MNDRVLVSNLCIHGHHGVLEAETILGQKFYVDLECALDIGPAAADDDYTKAVCYGSLCQLAIEVSRQGPYKLVETLASRIATRILAVHPLVTFVKVRVRKPSAPLPHVFDWVGVEVERTRTYAIGFSLGSNIGDKSANIRLALEYLQMESSITLEKTSAFYGTRPWGKTDQDDFINACAVGNTDLKPLEVLKICKDIENVIGRKPGERWGPRLIDIDLLFMGELRIETSILTLPHKELEKRPFVLVPLAEIAPATVINGHTVEALARAANIDASAVIRLD